MQKRPPPSFCNSWCETFWRTAQTQLLRLSSNSNTGNRLPKTLPAFRLRSQRNTRRRRCSDTSNQDLHAHCAKGQRKNSLLDKYRLPRTALKNNPSTLHIRGRVDSLESYVKDVWQEAIDQNSHCHEIRRWKDFRPLVRRRHRWGTCQQQCNHRFAHLVCCLLP